MALINIQRDAIMFDELNKVFTQTQELLMSVVHYSQPIQVALTVCNHPQQMIDLQRQLTDLQAKQFLLLQFNHTKSE
jgi:hypothetical protein